MRFVLNNYYIEPCNNEFQFYEDLDKYVTKSDVNGILLGENARDYRAFYALEAIQPFTGLKYRIGIILDSKQKVPTIYTQQFTSKLVVGMNSEINVISLENSLSIESIQLDSWFHHFLCNGNALVAVHELGATILGLPEFEKISDLCCEIVADATLSNSELKLTSMEGEVIKHNFSK